MLYPERLYLWCLSALSGEAGGRLHASEANLDTDEEGLKVRKGEGYLAEGWGAVAGGQPGEGQVC